MSDSNFKDMLKVTDLATRQKLFFYNLCKAGIVVFDLSDESHIKILTQIIDLVTNQFSKNNIAGDSEDTPIDLKNKQDLDLLIVHQLLSHTVNSNK